MTHSKLSIQDLCSIALFAAVTAVMAQISIPMPLGVPMTMQTFAVTLTAVVLGARKGAVSVLVYIFLGIVGLPVFSNFTGGAQCLAGPTGGFIISFPIMAYLIGLGVDKFKHIKGGFTLCLIAGTISNYVFGVLIFVLVTGGTVAAALTACVIPFIPTAVLKAVLASILGLKIRARLNFLTV